MASRFSDGEVRIVRNFVASHKGESPKVIRSLLRRAKVPKALIDEAFKRERKSPSGQKRWFFWIIVILLALIVLIGAFLLASGR